MADHTIKCPPVPKHRKVFGTALNVDNELLLYTEAEMQRHGERCFAAGQASATPRGNANDLSASQIAEEDRWAAYRNGTGPRPGRHG